MKLHHPSYLLLFLVVSPLVDALKTPSPVSGISALNVPRGGGLPSVKPQHMIKVFCGFYALNGALSFPAPESAKDFALIEGTDDYVVFENLGAISLSYASLVYFLKFKGLSMAVPKMVALSSLPLAYVSYKNMLKGITHKMTGSNLHGPINTLFWVSCIYAILSSKVADPVLLAKVMALPPLAIGTISQFDQELARKIGGFNAGVVSKKGKSIFVWYAALMAGWGALILMTLQLKLSAMDAIGRAAVLETLFMVDCIWIRKWNIGVAPDASNYVFLGIPLLTAVTIFLNK
ncbi:expressed unknown protein [Seminavis robusta]|uniref:Uncharacterized protein n=1 Tax=Seminavis robusta TaxID=568900 RepID=A0A9N8HDH2_9STRA|nr:expressed unknown protein [Seminavis robusta]|eukprot:Sro460_g147510.1 n/a (290) ;mRNA; f:33004-33873